MYKPIFDLSPGSPQTHKIDAGAWPNFKVRGIRWDKYHKTERPQGGKCDFTYKTGKVKKKKKERKKERKRKRIEKKERKKKKKKTRYFLHNFTTFDDFLK